MVVKGLVVGIVPAQTWKTVKASSPKQDVYIMQNSIMLDEQNDLDGDHRAFQNLVRKPFHSLQIAVNTAARSDVKEQG